MAQLKTGAESGPPIGRALEDFERRMPRGFVETETISLIDAAGRVAAQNLCARVAVPSAHVALQFGYAVHSADTRRLDDDSAQILQEQTWYTPGADTQELAVHPNGFVKCFGGYPVPEGADAVAPSMELTESIEWFSPRPVQPMENIKPKGFHLDSGDVIVKAGHRITPAALGVMAQSGIAEVLVNRRPRLAVIAARVGRIAHDAGELKPGMQYDGFSPLVATTLERWGYLRPDIIQYDGELFQGTQEERVKVVMFKRAVVDAYDLAILPGEIGNRMSFWDAGESAGDTPTRLPQIPETSLNTRRGRQRQPMKSWNVKAVDATGKPTGQWRNMVKDHYGVMVVPTGDYQALMVNLHVQIRGMLDRMEGVFDPAPNWKPGRLIGDVPRVAVFHKILLAYYDTDSDGLPGLRPILDEKDFAADADVLIRVEAGEGVQPSGSSVHFLILK